MMPRFRALFGVLAIAIALVFPAPLAPHAPAAVAAQSTSELEDEIADLKATLTKTRKDRDKYRARWEKEKEKNAELEAEIADLEATIEALRSEPEPTPRPTRVSNDATAEEIAYWREVKIFVVRLLAPADEVGRIASMPDFADNPTRWYELIDAMQPFHGIWADWQAYSPPTQRLEPYHQAMTGVLYNYDQAATKFEQGVNNLDVSLIEAAVDHVSEASEALNRATREIETWERTTGTQVEDI